MEAGEKNSNKPAGFIKNVINPLKENEISSVEVKSPTLNKTSPIEIISLLMSEII